jgi:hypothetical protein
MTPIQTYVEARERAGEMRASYGISGPRLMLSDIRRIYKDQEITLTYWPHKLKVLRGAYIRDDLGPTVMVWKGLPDDTKIFTLAHELKHHVLDSGVCSTTDADENSDLREIAAEVFAAELLFPEDLFVGALTDRGIQPGSNPELEALKYALIKVKRETGTTLSYTGLAKMTERLGYAHKGALKSVHWKKLEIGYFGVPFYARRRATN